MDQLISRFTEQLKEALEIADAANIQAHSLPIHNIYVAGLGGSGIGGDFVAGFIRQDVPVPYSVGKGYFIPSYVGENTLAIVSSYSGNTEETLISFEQILKTGAKIICISSGGKLIQKAIELGLDYIKIPDNWPSPRACLGYSLVQQLGILAHLQLTDRRYLDAVASSIDLLNSEEENIKEIVQTVANQIHGKIPVIYTTDRMEAVGVRFRQQVNENSKCLCWHHIIPEMNHNELVGWREKNENLAVLYFRNEDEYARNKMRIEINQNIIKDYTSTIINLHSKGSNQVEKALYHVHLGDWISWYLAQLRGFDAIEVDVINYLKGELAKH